MTATPHQEPFDLNHPALRARAVAAARGDAPFDMLITGGRLLDAVTGLIREADIGLVGALIASVHAPASRTDAVEIIDATGAVLTPGLIDTHMHVESSMVTPAEYASAVLPRGVTTVVWDPHEFANVHGLDGVRWAIEAARVLPLRMILLAPSCVPSAPGLELAGADFDASIIAEMLRSPAVGGVAEVMNMRGVIDGDPHMNAIVNSGLAAGKLVCGHARGLEGADLNAFMAAGVTSDHELTSGADLAAKLAAGLTIELRGSHDHLLEEFVDVLNDLGHLPPTVTLCTDDVFPDELFESGGLDDVIKRLVRYGMKPEWALSAATFNAAQRLKRSDLGLVAAGRRADLVLFDDVTEFRARLVISSGRIVARNGAMEAAVQPLDTAPLTNSVKLSALTE
ncbi:amidohydrolase family protein, partial [Rhizobium sp. Pop5]